MATAKPTAFLLQHFSGLALRTCGSAITPIFFRSSTLDLRNSQSWIVNTLDTENSFSFAMIALSFQKSLYVIGNRMTTYSTGAPFQLILTHTTSVRMNWLLFKNGNLHSISPSSTSSTIPAKAYFVAHPLLKHNNSVFDASGAKHAGKPPHPRFAGFYILPLSSRDYRVGLPFTTLAPTPNNVTSRNNIYAPMQEVSSNAMLFAAWLFTFKNHTAAWLFNPWIAAFPFGKGRRPPRLFHFVDFGYSLPTYQNAFVRFLFHGTVPIVTYPSRSTNHP